MPELNLLLGTGADCTVETTLLLTRQSCKFIVLVPLVIIRVAGGIVCVSEKLVCVIVRFFAFYNFFTECKDLF